MRPRHPDLKTPAPSGGRPPPILLALAPDLLCHIQVWGSCCPQFMAPSQGLYNSLNIIYLDPPFPSPRGPDEYLTLTVPTFCRW